MRNIYIIYIDVYCKGVLKIFFSATTSASNSKGNLVNIAITYLKIVESQGLGQFSTVSRQALSRQSYVCCIHITIIDLQIYHAVCKRMEYVCDIDILSTHN